MLAFLADVLVFLICLAYMAGAAGLIFYFVHRLNNAERAIHMLVLEVSKLNGLDKEQAEQLSHRLELQLRHGYPILHWK